MFASPCDTLSWKINSLLQSVQTAFCGFLVGVSMCCTCLTWKRNFLNGISSTAYFPSYTSLIRTVLLHLSDAEGPVAGGPPADPTHATN